MSSDALKFVYTTAEVARAVDIGRSTLNKYARALEDAGYVFAKDDKGLRGFTDHDIVAFKALVDLCNRGLKLDSAVNTVVSRYKAGDQSDSVDLVATNGSSINVATVNAMNAKIDQLIEVVAHLTEKMDGIIDDRVRKEVAAATAGVNEEVSRVLQEVRAIQDDTNQKIGELGSRLEAHGKRKKFLGLF